MGHIDAVSDGSDTGVKLTCYTGMISTGSVQL